MAFVVGRGFLAAVPARTPESIVGKLAGLIDDQEVALETVIALLPLAGDQEVEGFLVAVPGGAGEEDASLSVVVRGDIVADISTTSGSRRFAARGIRPWLLSDFQFVTGAEIFRGERPAGRPEGSAAMTGMIRGTLLHWSLIADQADARDHFDDRPAEIRLPSGDERPIDAVFLLGRRPQAPVPSDKRYALIPLASRTTSVSATHLEIRQDGEAIFITDLNSTNGTRVLVPGGRRERLRAGEPFRAPAGTTIDVGDGNIIEILPPSEH